MKIIHVNRTVIQRNGKREKPLPVCRVEDGKTTRYAMEVHIKGPSKMIYRPDRPLKCGARLWLETESEIELIGETTYKEMMAVN